jgi:AcrR family transcriptional regulator
VSSQPGRRRQRALSADEIVRVAIRLARQEGVEAVSMRRIGDELGSSPMAVYRHVQDREDLILRMLDHLADRVDRPVTDGRPRERIELMMRTMHEGFRGDPWVVRVLAHEGLASPRILPMVEAIFKAFADAGFDPPTSRALYNLLFQFLYGETLMSHFERLSTYSRRMVEDADVGAYPTLIAAVGTERHASAEYFEQNLPRVLDGIFGPDVENAGKAPTAQ